MTVICVKGRGAGLQTVRPFATLHCEGLTTVHVRPGYCCLRSVWPACGIWRRWHSFPLRHQVASRAVDAAQAQAEEREDQELCTERRKRTSDCGEEGVDGRAFTVQGATAATVDKVQYAIVGALRRRWGWWLRHVPSCSMCRRGVVRLYVLLVPLPPAAYALGLVF